MSLNDSTISESMPLQQPIIVINNHVSQAPVGQPAVQNNVSKSEIEKWSHRIKITSWIMIAIGAFSAVNMVFCHLNARAISAKIFKGGMHTDWNGKDTMSAENGDELLSRDEFALYDVFKGFAFYGILLGVSLACAGCKSLMATKANSASFTRRAIRCTACKVFFLVVFTFLMHGKGKEMKAILARHQPHPHPPHPTPHPTFDRELFIANETNAEKPESFLEPKIVNESPEEPESFQIANETSEEKSEIIVDPKPEFTHHKEHHKRHGMRCPFPAILFFNFIAHFYFMRKLRRAQEDFVAAGGELVPVETACDSCPFSKE